MKPKYLRVLEALEKGVDVRLPIATLAIGEDENGVSRLCSKAMRYSNESSEGEEVLLGFDVSLNDFILMCDQLDEMEIPIVIPRVAA